LMVVAKTQRALSILTRHFHHRLVQKRYTAILSGAVSEEAGVIDAPLGINPLKSPPRWVFADGKPAETRFRVTIRMNAATLVELEPVTGRTNQLRIHCAYIGHPIVGDDIYGAVVGGQLSEVRETPDDPSFSQLTAAPGHRLCLHASRLAFHHPDGGRWMEFTSPLPEAMRAVLEGSKSKK
jgi:23S rRNA pseudouridine1911/1915/1917 synthase